MVDYLLVIMSKLARFCVLFMMCSLPMMASAEAMVAPAELVDTGTDESATGIADVNVAAEVNKTKQFEEAVKLKEARMVQREVEAVLGKEGRGGGGFRDFFYPKYRGMRLSYCAVDNKTCGLELASKYCKLLGYDTASKMMIDHNIGLTRYAASSLKCQGWRCDGFKLITCKNSLKISPTPVYYYRMKDFAVPRFENYRVDWCYKKNKGCGKQAANAFCRKQGYKHARGYEKETKVAATRTIGSGSLCFGQACKGFDRITCYR